MDLIKKKVIIGMSREDFYKEGYRAIYDLDGNEVGPIFDPINYGVIEIDTHPKEAHRT